MEALFVGVILGAIGVALFLYIYMFMRTNWVGSKRRKLIYTDYSKYKLLPDYDTMVYRKFWCWDINGFLPPNFKGGRDGKSANS